MSCIQLVYNLVPSTRLVLRIQARHVEYACCSQQKTSEIYDVFGSSETESGLEYMQALVDFAKKNKAYKELTVKDIKKVFTN